MSSGFERLKSTRLHTLSTLLALTAICLGLTAQTVRATEINDLEELVGWDNLAF